MNEIHIYADGACKGNPGPGGWGVLILHSNGNVEELGGASSETTNNKMELTAVGKAIRHLEKIEGILKIYTDSSYVIQGITEWMPNWISRGWKTSNNKPVENQMFWKRLKELIDQRSEFFQENGKVQFIKVKGHSGNPGNERVDKIASDFALGRKPHLFKGDKKNYSF